MPFGSPRAPPGFTAQAMCSAVRPFGSLASISAGAAATIALIAAASQRLAATNNAVLKEASSSPGLRPPDHRDHRVAEILHPFGQAMGLDLREAGVTKVKLDEVSVPLVIELPPDGNYLILGPPGSGKTNLLLIRAEYLIRTDRPHLYVLMFNDPLHDFVVRGGVHYDVPSSKIRKMLSWEIVLLREHGVVVEEVPDEDS